MRPELGHPSLISISKLLFAAKACKVLGNNQGYQKFSAAAVTELARPFGCCVKFDNISGDLIIEGPNFEVATDLWFAKHLINAYFSPNAEMQLGEGYMQGRWTVSNGRLEDVLSHFWLAKNKSKVIKFIRVIGNWRRFRKSQVNTPTLSKNNIKSHYDDDSKENKLFEKMLGSRMLYSSALYDNELQTLDEAQDNKVRIIIDKLNINEGDNILEIGSGWGTLSNTMSGYNANIIGLTLSEFQIKYCQRNRTEKISGSPQFLISDYREFFIQNKNAKFDKIVCVEVLDHIGLAQFDTFFRLLNTHLKPQGVVVFQLILRPERGQTSKWIDKYIYPGGYIPSYQEVLESVHQSGLEVRDFVNFGGSHYARTLFSWRKNLQDARPFIEQRFGVDEENFRKWEFFLSYSKSSFESGGFTTSMLTVGRA